MKHNPGPWTVDLNLEDGEFLEILTRPTAVDDAIVIASIATEVDSDTVDANARLIAAAPDLLSFTERFLSKLLYAPDDQVVMKFDDLAALRDEAKALVAKATGGAE